MTTFRHRVCVFCRRPTSRFKVSHHTTSGDAVLSFASETSLVFVMDGKDEDEENGKGKGKGRRKKKPELTPRNFGKKVSASKLKQATKLIIGWRCRLGKTHLLFLIHLSLGVFGRLDNNVDGTRKLTPMRPCAFLSGLLTVNDSSIRLC